MGKTIVKGEPPPRWGLLEQPDGEQRRVLWFGAHRISLDDIQSVDAEEVRERPLPGLLLGANIFLAVALIFAFGVFESGWRERFLLGAFILTLLGIAGLYESTKISAQRFFEIRIATRGHGVVTFASADEAEVHALLGALAGAGVSA